ncbi:putative P-type phospholipid transporter [Helianthus annuus]|nr:putative P-type phospholipid transporter [Helianthus annuus]
MMIGVSLSTMSFSLPSRLSSLDCLTRDVSVALSKKYPQLYKEGIHNTFFNWKVVGTLALFSLYQSIVVYNFAVAFSTSGLTSTGEMLGHWDVSTMAFTCLVITFNLRLLMMCSTATGWHVISIGDSVVLCFLFIFIYAIVFVNKGTFFTIYVLMSTIYFYLMVILVPICALVCDFIYQGF